MAVELTGKNLKAKYRVHSPVGHGAQHTDNGAGGTKKSHDMLSVRAKVEMAIESRRINSGITIVKALVPNEKGTGMRTRWIKTREVVADLSMEEKQAMLTREMAK